MNVEVHEATDFYSGDVYPVRVGVYMAEFVHERPYFFLWDGTHWHAGGRTIEEALEQPRGGSNRPIRWCGLTRDAFLKRGGRIAWAKPWCQGEEVVL